MEQTTYERALGRFYPYLSAIGEQVEIFKSYPIRVRTEQPIKYYEVGASNISQNGKIAVGKNDTLKEYANSTAFEKLHLRPGDIILPYRSKRLYMGLLLEPPSYPLVPNPGLIIIRSGSVELGKYLFTFLQHPFIHSYIESNIIHKADGKSILDIDKFRLLVIPFAADKERTRASEADRYYNYLMRISQLQKKFEYLATILSSGALAGEDNGIDTNYLGELDVHIKKLEEIFFLLEASPVYCSAIELLQSDFNIDKETRL